MHRIMSVEEAVNLIQDGDCICLNSFVGIENPVALHEGIYKKYHETNSPKNLTVVSSAGFGLWDEDRCAEGYIREGAVSRLICGHVGAMLSTKKLVLEDRFEAYNLPLGCISHAIRAQAAGLPGAFSKVGLDIFVDPRQEGPGINRISTSKDFVKLIELEGEEYLYYQLPKLNVALIKGTVADKKGNISFDDQYMSGDALSVCQAVKANKGTVIVQVDRVVKTPTRPRNTIIPGSLVDAIVVVEPEEYPVSFRALTGDFEIPYHEWKGWKTMIDAVSNTHRKTNPAYDLIGKRAAEELRKDDLVNIGIGIPETVADYARESGILKEITMTVESGGMGGLPVSGKVFGAMIGATSVYDMANQFDLYNSGTLDICFMGALEVDRFGNVNAHRSETHYAGIGGFANITAKTPNIIFCLTFNASGLVVTNQEDSVTVVENGKIPKFVEQVKHLSFNGRSAVKNGQRVLYVTERCVFELGENGLKLVEVYPGIDVQKDILDLLPFPVEYPAKLSKREDA